MSGFLKNIIVI